MVGFEVLIGGIPFRNQFFKSPKFCWSFSH